MIIIKTLKMYSTQMNEKQRLEYFLKDSFFLSFFLLAQKNTV